MIKNKLYCNVIELEKSDSADLERCPACDAKTLLYKIAKATRIVEGTPYAEIYECHSCEQLTVVFVEGRGWLHVAMRKGDRL